MYLIIHYSDQFFTQINLPLSDHPPPSPRGPLPRWIIDYGELLAHFYLDLTYFISEQWKLTDTYRVL